MIDPASDMLTGHCHCGSVAFALPHTAAGVLACHCEDCQRMHGNFNAFLAVPKSEVRMTGADVLVWYASSETARRAFCGTCGARVLKEVTAADRWLISAGLIDGPTGRRIIKNLWEQSKPDWYDIPLSASEGQTV
ncbi:GFA family protein [Jannaschia formosa]|uniref:GFA family protein n=1 Tax=Jannaschia formosa TaxID=2259592 RepID=UPI000E1C1CD7|nr:GFA family protein [Jannaschia formosa]TFL18481.1 GFA family protein [Jannaschia formosa]